MTDSEPAPKIQRRKFRPTTWADLEAGTCQEQPWRSSGVSAEMGRSSTVIQCPFCQKRCTAYVWSLSGSGKRCQTPGCGALFGSAGMSIRRMENCHSIEVSLPGNTAAEFSLKTSTAPQDRRPIDATFSAPVVRRAWVDRENGLKLCAELRDSPPGTKARVTMTDRDERVVVNFTFLPVTI